MLSFWDARKRQQKANARDSNSSSNNNNNNSATGPDDGDAGESWEEFDHRTSKDSPTHTDSPAAANHGSGGSGGVDDDADADAVRALVRSLQSKVAQQNIRRKSFLGSELTDAEATAMTDVQMSLAICKAILMDARTPVGALIAHWQVRVYAFGV